MGRDIKLNVQCTLKVSEKKRMFEISKLRLGYKNLKYLESSTDLFRSIEEKYYVFHFSFFSPCSPSNKNFHFKSKFVFPILKAQTWWSKSQGRVKFVHFRASWVLLISNQHQTETGIDHYHNCINPLVKFCHDLYYSSPRLIYQKLAFDFLLRSPGFVFC